MLIKLLGWLFDRVDLIKQADIKCPFVCMYVRLSTKSFFNFNEIWHVGRLDKRCMTLCCMTQSKVKVTSPSKLEIRPFSTAIFSAIYTGSWQLATDSSTRAQYLNLFGPDFLIFVLVSVSRDLEFGRNVSCEESTVQSRTGLIWFNNIYSNL